MKLSIVVARAWDGEDARLGIELLFAGDPSRSITQGLGLSRTTVFKPVLGRATIIGRVGSGLGPHDRESRRRGVLAAIQFNFWPCGLCWLVQRTLALTWAVLGIGMAMDL